MSADDNTESPSWHTNLNNSVTGEEQGNSADPAVALADLMGWNSRELPTPAERVSEFHAKYPERARIRLSDTHGVSVRRDYCHDRYAEWHSEAQVETEDSQTGDRLVERRPMTWGEAVQELLESHESKRHTLINLEKGRPSEPEYNEFSIPAETRWNSSYQKRYFAQMKGWLREIIGGERPSGGVSEGEYDNPKIVLITLSASSVPANQRAGPGDHTRIRRASWSDCYDTLRNIMRRKGVNWQYDRRTEPHTGERGGGVNSCYGHDHVVLLVDGDVSLSDFRPVVEKHVEECDWAGPVAHDLDVADWDANAHDVGTVEIREPDQLNDIAAYIADYTSIEPTDLLDRSVEFIAWAAAVTATNSKTITRSDAAKWASTADRCKQQFESEIADQSVDHGENVLRDPDGRGPDLVCACCESPHGIDQEQTLASARMDNSPTAVADGGLDEREERLRQRWPSARSAAVVGESIERTAWRNQIEEYLRLNPDPSKAKILDDLGLPPDAGEVINEIDAGFDPDEPASFERGPQWRVKSVEVYEEEYPASAGNGVDMVETRLPIQRLLEETPLGDDGAERTYWRCQITNVGIRSGRSMAGYLVKHGVEHPEPASEILKAERGPLAQSG